MNVRNYNIFFHLHTVSGIVISVLLYVIFFTGSFSFFRDEIVNWERNDGIMSHTAMQLDVDAALDTIAKSYELQGRTIAFKKYYEEAQVNVSLSASQDTLLPADKIPGAFFYMNQNDYSTQSYQESYSLGEFLYRLHFFAQVPYPYGYHLSGFTAFFFLFALITGILIHWDKIVSNFYVFRPRAKLKTLWTDAHTALGTIGFPFQFIYAVTGAFFMLQLFMAAPNMYAFFGGNRAKMMDALEYNVPEYEYTHESLVTNQSVSINDYIEKATARWENFNVIRVEVLNYGDAAMHVFVEGQLDYNKRFTGIGKVCYEVNTGKIVYEKNPYTDTTYLDGVKNSLYRLHFGDYGGYPLRIMSFILGIIGCVVILSGVLIWLTARDKKNMPEKKRRFNNRVVTIYLAICLSLYPITALSFLAVKLWGSGMNFLYYFYFLGWLALTILFIIKADNKFTNKYTLLSGSVLGLCIPFVNGFTTGNWFWLTLANSQFHIFFVDVFWLVISIIGLYAFTKLIKKKV